MLFLKFGRQISWQRHLIEDLWLPVDYLQELSVRYDTQKSQAVNTHERFGSLIRILSPGLLLLLEDANDPQISKAWLRLAWRHHRELTPGTLTQVLGATADLFSKEDDSIIFAFAPLASAWIDFHDEDGEWDVWNEEQRGICAELVNKYLASAWKTSWCFDLKMLKALSRITSEDYATGGL